MIALDKTKLGVSRIGAILGVDRYSSPHTAWAEILGLESAEKPDFVEEAAENGREFQRPIFNRWIALNGVAPTFVLEDESRTPPSLDWLRYTPDFIWSAAGVSAGLTECKLISTFRFDAEDWGREINALPDRVRFQVIGQIAGMRADADFWREQFDVDPFEIKTANVAAAEVGFGRIHHHAYTVEYVPELGEMVLEEMERFWRDYVLTKTPPPIDGSKACSEWIERTFPRTGQKTVREATSEEIEMLVALQRARADIVPIEAREKELINKIKAAIGDDLGIKGPGLSARMKTYQGRPSWKQVAEILANQLALSDGDLEALVAQHMGAPYPVFELKTEKERAT